MAKKKSKAQTPTTVNLGESLEIEVVRKYCEPIIEEISRELALINDKISKEIGRLEKLTQKYDLNIQTSNTHNTELDLHTHIIFHISPKVLYDKFKLEAIQKFIEQMREG